MKATIYHSHHSISIKKVEGDLRYIRKMGVTFSVGLIPSGRRKVTEYYPEGYMVVVEGTGYPDPLSGMEVVDDMVSRSRHDSGGGAYAEFDAKVLPKIPRGKILVYENALSSKRKVVEYEAESEDKITRNALVRVANTLPPRSAERRTILEFLTKTMS